jgi:hypothetical protein
MVIAVAEERTPRPSLKGPHTLPFNSGFTIQV